MRFRTLAVEGSLEDLEGGLVAMSLNDPPLTVSDTCVVEGPVTIRGWAHARGGIESVAVIVDGRRYEALRPVVRTDLLDYYGADAAAEAGFVLRLHPSECPPGVHRIAVVATGRDGDAVGVEGDVECRPGAPAADAGPAPVATVDWIEDRRAPIPAPNPNGANHSAAEWESRARLAEADAAASRVEAGLASTRQEAALRELAEVRAKLSELESGGD